MERADGPPPHPHQTTTQPATLLPSLQQPSPSPSPHSSPSDAAHSVRMSDEEGAYGWIDPDANAVETNRLLRLQPQPRSGGGGGVGRVLPLDGHSGPATCFRRVSVVVSHWLQSACGPRSRARGLWRRCSSPSSTRPSSPPYPLPVRLALVALCLFALFVFALQTLYLATGIICSPTGTIYADRSMDARFFQIGRLRQDELHTVLLQGLHQIDTLFKHYKITDWWLDSGMLLGYYRDPVTGWIPWDTDADIMVAVRHVPQILRMDAAQASKAGALDTDTWFLFTQQYAHAVHGAWLHSRHCVFHLVHRASGARIEVWTGPVVPTVGELVHPPESLLCPEEWAADMKNSGRPADLLFPLSSVELAPGVHVQLPRLDTLGQYLEAVLPGSTAGPPRQRQLLCQHSSGASDRWWNRQLLPSFLYQWVWRLRTASVLQEGRRELQRDREWEQAQVQAHGSAVAIPADGSDLDAAASFLSSQGYFYGMCVGLLQLEESSPDGRRMARRFLEEATQLPWVRAIQHIRRAGLAEGGNDKH